MAKVLWCVDIETEVGIDEAGFCVVKKTRCNKAVVAGTEHCSAHQIVPVWPV